MNWRWLHEDVLHSALSNHEIHLEYQYQGSQHVLPKLGVGYDTTIILIAFKAFNLRYMFGDFAALSISAKFFFNFQN